MSGSTVMVPDDRSESERPPKSDTLTPLKAMTDSGLASKLVAVLPQMVTRTEKLVSSTMVRSRLSYGLLVVLDVIDETSATSFRTPTISSVESFSTLCSSWMLQKLNRTCGTLLWSSAFSTTVSRSNVSS